MNGAPFTDELKMTERFRRVNLGLLEIDVTIDDPFTITTIRQRLLPDDKLIEFVCQENEKSTPHFVN